jgi:hypothetical protein
MYELLPMIITKVQEEEVVKAHNLIESPFLAMMAMTYDVTSTFIGKFAFGGCCNSLFAVHVKDVDRQLDLSKA